MLVGRAREEMNAGVLMFAFLVFDYLRVAEPTQDIFQAKVGATVRGLYLVRCGFESIGMLKYIVEWTTRKTSHSIDDFFRLTLYSFVLSLRAVSILKSIIYCRDFTSEEEAGPTHHANPGTAYAFARRAGRYYRWRSFGNRTEEE